MHITAVISHIFKESLLFCILDFADNRLLDLYGVEFGELPEVTSLLTPYMRAYCHSKMHLVQKFAQELIYYGYAGLQSHFIYHNLLAATKVTRGLKRGFHIEARNATVMMTKLYKFVKAAEVFSEASLSEPSRALQLKLQDEILAQVEKDEGNIRNWLKKRINDANDWPNLCLLKDADKKERNTLIIKYQRIKNIRSNSTPEQLLMNEPWRMCLEAVCESGQAYARASKEEVAVKARKDCKEPEMRDNVMFVSYYPEPCCGEKRKVFVSWKKVAVCFHQESKAGAFSFGLCSKTKGKKCILYAYKGVLDIADRF